MIAKTIEFFAYCDESRTKCSTQLNGSTPTHSPVHFREATYPLTCVLTDNLVVILKASTSGYSEHYTHDIILLSLLQQILQTELFHFVLIMLDRICFLDQDVDLDQEEET